MSDRGSRIGELLFGIVALQKGYLSLAQLMDTLAARGPSTLADALIKRGLLDPQRRADIEAQVSSAVEANGGDEHVTLQNLQTDQQALLESLSSSLLDSADATVRSQPTVLPPHLGLAPVFVETPGRYDWRETEELGRGGVGRVVRTWDTSMGRDVAVKQLIHKADTDKARRSLEARFLREARLTGQLEHPAVLPVYEVGRQEDGGLYYAMQRVRGRTLHDAIHSTPDLGDRLKLMPHFLTACQAMAYAHSRGAVHRDLKPQNIMVGQYGETYVLDWGLARVAGHTDFQARERAMVPDLTGNVLEGRAIGTPAYMSPEQADGRFADIDERSDVWGLGSVLFELIARRPPFSGANPIALLGQVREDEVVPVSSLAPDAPAELCAIAMKCLTRNRAGRYPNAGAVAADVQAWLSDRRVSAHRYGAVELLQRFVRQNRLATAVALGALVAMVTAGSAALYRIKDERDAARELAQLFLEDVSLKLEPMAGSRELLEELTTKTLPRYEQRLDPLSGSREERLKLGWAWQRIGRLTYRVGKKDESDHAFRFATRVADALLDEHERDAEAQALAAEARVGLADVSTDRGDVKVAEQQLREGLKHAQRSLALEPELVQGIETLSRVWSRLADLLNATDRNAEGMTALQRSRELDRQLLSLKPNDAKVIVGFGIGALQAGQLYFSRGDLPHAREAYEEAMEVSEKGLAQFPNDDRLKSDYAYAVGETSLIDRIVGRPPRGLLTRARKMMDEVLTDNPDNLEYLAQTIELTAEQQDMAATWRLSHHLMDLDASGEYLTSALLGAFISGHHDETLKMGLNAKGLARFAGAVYGAMSAAVLNDWGRVAILAARAKGETAQMASASWSWRQMQAGVANASEPAATPLRKLCVALDEFTATANPKPVVEALTELEAVANTELRKPR
jgi:tRNA A-37 threonylcarbamoyl transferase component Bud32/tetratricopeptide (TPR) repeat protein